MTRLNHKNSKIYPLIAKTFALLIILIISTSNSIYSQSPINQETAFLWKLKLDTLPDKDFTEEYLYRFQKESFRLFKNDEFEMRKAESDLVDEINSLEENTIYNIKFQTTFSDYDFDKKGFNCIPFDENTRIALFDYVFGMRLPTNAALDLEFLNGQEIELFPIDEEQANMFVKERKNYKNGKIDRSITLNIYFVMKGLYSTDNVTNKSIETITANILQVDFYDSNELDNTPLGSANTSYKSSFDEKVRLAEEHTEMKKKLDELSASNEPDSDLIVEIKTILENSTLNNELKASLIKATIDHHKENGAAFSSNAD